MKLIPLLFQTEMVNAVMREVDPKTVTRRTRGLDKINENPEQWRFVDKLFGSYKDGFDDNDYPVDVYRFINRSTNQPINIKSPYGKEGDVLWVREKWRKNHMPTGWPYHHYAGDEVYTNPDNERWKPSIHMPFKACRLFLLNKGVTVERLHDITEQQAIAEGIQPLLMSRMQIVTQGQLYRNYLTKPEVFNEGVKPVESFRSLWIKINGQESWDSNPWVWRVGFEKTEKPSVEINGLEKQLKNEQPMY